ncbi:MAG: hypothetical protein LBQ08_05095 [Holosporaceae bacterium]|jgi:hypothetical protein|nr:hypothetical protein [Holosporaceae bacterium]
MANFNSNIAAAIAQKNSIRTNNFRGSLICTTLTIANNAMKAPVDSIISLMPIQWGSSLKSIRWRVSAEVETGGLRGTLNVGGINESFYISSGVGVAGSIAEIHSPTIKLIDDDLHINVDDLLGIGQSEKTMYESLLNDNKTERDTFKPFKNDRYGMLYLKISQAYTTPPEDITAQVEIQYVDPSPSWSRMATLSE